MITILPFCPVTQRMLASSAAIGLSKLAVRFEKSTRIEHLLSVAFLVIKKSTWIACYVTDAEVYVSYFELNF